MLETSPAATPQNQSADTQSTSSASVPSIDLQAQRIALMLEAMLSLRDRPGPRAHPLNPSALDQGTLATLLGTIGLAPTLPIAGNLQSLPGRPTDPNRHRPSADLQFDPAALALAQARILNLLQQRGVDIPASDNRRDVATDASRMKGDPAQASPRNAAESASQWESQRRAGSLNAELPRYDVAQLNRSKDGAPSPDIKAIINEPSNGTARILQAVLQTEMSLRTSKVAVSDPMNQSSTAQISNLDSIRNSISEKTSALKTSLERISEQHQTRLASEKSQESPSTATTRQGIDPQKIGANEKSEPPKITIASESRADTPAPQTLREGPSNSDVMQPRNQVRAESPARARDAQASPESYASIRGDILRSHSLLSAIERATHRLVNFDLLRQVDRAMETAVISAAAAITLGVITTDTVIKELLALLKLLNDNLALDARAKAEAASENNPGELEARNLDQANADQDNAAGSVADVTGLIVMSGSETPVADVLISAGNLGFYSTNPQGYYKLSNLPIGTSYSLTFSSPGLLFHPASISGTVGPDNFIRVVASPKAGHVTLAD